MKIEDVKIEDAADANYVIRKFFNNDFKNIKMAQLEELVLTVYNMGKGSGAATDSAADSAPDKAPAKANPFKLYEKVKPIEDIEIGHSGEFIKTSDIGSITLINGDIATVIFEAGEDGEMIEVNISFDKLEKAD